MYQVIRQTHEEKVEMYSKLSKEKLVEMLINLNEMLSNYLPPIYEYDGIQNKKDTQAKTL